MGGGCEGGGEIGKNLMGKKCLLFGLFLQMASSKKKRKEKKERKATGKAVEQLPLRTKELIPLTTFMPTECKDYGQQRETNKNSTS